MLKDNLQSEIGSKVKVTWRDFFKNGHNVH